MSTFTLMRRLTAVALFTLIAQAPVANAAILSLHPDTTFAGNGESISLDLVVSELGDFGPDSLGVFDIDVGYDSLALSFIDYTFGNFLGDLGLFEALDIGFGDNGGSVNLSEVSLLSSGALDVLQPSEFILATLNFSVLNLAAGETTQAFIFRGASLGDGNGEQVDVADGRSATIEGRASIPLPGTLLLMLSALLGFTLTRRTRQQ